MAGDVASQSASPESSPARAAGESILRSATTTGRRHDGIWIPDYLADFRSLDGTGNEFANPEWGSTDEQLFRVATAHYGDGAWMPAGTDRPNPCEICNAIVAQAGETATNRQMSAFVHAWGQFIDHDRDLTEPPVTGVEPMPIAVPAGDAYFDPANMGTQFIPFIRSGYDAATGSGADNPRQQMNQITAWIDGSMVYEFLPAVLGEGALDSNEGYDVTVNPSVANEFLAAAFRMYTLINDDLEFFGNDGRAVFEEGSLAEAFDDPDLLRESGINSILKHSASAQSQEFDNQIVESLRHFLFGHPGQDGFDLASLNTQRGRDHGLADYNAVRVAYGLSPVDSFDDISSDPAIRQALQDLYGDVDDIDLWVGGLAEDHLRRSSVGLLVRTIVADQFERLRDGNRRQGFREPALARVAVELLDDEGEVIATALTKFGGRYQFDEFRETGDYQIRIVVPSGMRTTTTNPVDVLISRGELATSGVDFGLKPDDDGPRDRTRLSDEP